MHNHQDEANYMRDLQDAAPEMVAAFFSILIKLYSIKMSVALTWPHGN